MKDLSFLSAGFLSQEFFDVFNEHVFVRECECLIVQKSFVKSEMK